MSNVSQISLVLMFLLCITHDTETSVRLPTFTELDINEDFGIDSIDIDHEAGDHTSDDISSHLTSSNSVIRAVALLRGTHTQGVVRLVQHDSGPTQVSGHVTGLYPFGKHGFHVHQYKVIGDDCESAGEHYNPTREDHPSHVGDFGNLQADAQGVSRFDFSSETLSLRGKFSVLERSLVVHLHTDDLGTGQNAESRKSGNSGGRIACGTIKFVSIGNR